MAKEKNKPAQVDEAKFDKCSKEDCLKLMKLINENISVIEEFKEKLRKQHRAIKKWVNWLNLNKDKTPDELAALMETRVPGWSKKQRYHTQKI